MTAIVGLVDGGRALIGADSAGVGGTQLVVRRDRKVFTTGAYVIGFTDSFRMGQLLRWRLEPPAPPEDDADLERFMSTVWVDAVRATLKAGGWSRKESEQESAGAYLVGVRGRLFAVGSDYQVGEPADGYCAVGSGDQVAHGALHATAGLGLDPVKRVEMALAAAERHCSGVRGPFVLAWEPS